MMSGFLRGLVVAVGLTAPLGAGELTVEGTRFVRDGKQFEYTGLSFFNAIYNPAFNGTQAGRLRWLEKFRSYGINVLRVWCQWDSNRGFVDSCPTCTLYREDGSLRAERVAVLKDILRDAEQSGVVIELVLFSQESWRDGIRLNDGFMEKAVRELVAELKPHRNLTIQIWNEFSQHTVVLAKIVKQVDPARLVTSSPGFAGVLTASREETQVMDYLTPHTSRQDAGKPWEVGPAEIRYLIARYGRPVVDDEPARNGTASFGGPKVPTSPYDHVVQILNVRREGGYPTYHHDMFQMGAGHASVPPSGVPDPEFSAYHRVVFEFLKAGERYRQ